MTVFVSTGTPEALSVEQKDNSNLTSASGDPVYRIYLLVILSIFRKLFNEIDIRLIHFFKLLLHFQFDVLDIGFFIKCFKQQVGQQFLVLFFEFGLKSYTEVNQLLRRGIT